MLINTVLNNAYKKEKEENEMKRMKQQIQMLTESQKEILECLKYPEKLMKISQNNWNQHIE